MAWMSWNQIGRSKDLGGMLAKQEWQLLQNPESLKQNIIRTQPSWRPNWGEYHSMPGGVSIILKPQVDMESGKWEVYQHMG